VRGPYYKTQRKYIINLKVFKNFYFNSKIRLEKKTEKLVKKKEFLGQWILLLNSSLMKMVFFFKHGMNSRSV
jgi:hypothetical protein